MGGGGEVWLTRTSLMEAMLEDWSGPTFGSEKMLGVPMPVAVELSAAGVNAKITSGSPGIRLPALATKTRELFGRIAAWVGLIPMLALPISESPETSTCSTLPGFGATFELIAKTAWKFEELGGVTLIGITTGR